MGRIEFKDSKKMKKQFEIFYQFLLLGLVSFGGPIAHLGYFRKTFVEKLQWLSDESYSKIVALSQFLPGPSSSQVGFAIGLHKGGLWGGAGAFIGFTLPSFLLLYFLAVFSLGSTESPIVDGLINGLKLFAVVVVADATLGMFQNFCKSKTTILIFVISTLALLLLVGFLTQLLVIILAGVAGAIFIRSQTQEIETYQKPKLFPLVLFILPFIFALLFTNTNEIYRLFNSFYEVGSLVFGGGHVVLPLIAENVAVSESEFLVGYALAQAVPGPMFTIATYIGAVGFEVSPFLGALIATLAIFLPGFLLILAFRQSFESYSKKPMIASAIMGINASVVALLFAALCDPIFSSGVGNIIDLCVALFGFLLLRKYKLPIYYFILGFCIYGVLGVLYV